MTDIPLPATGSNNWTGWAAEQENLSDDAREIGSGRLTQVALDAKYKPLGADGTVWLDSFAGANDDQKLAAAMTAVGADTYPRTIQMSNRAHSFTVGNIQPYEGFRLRGPGGFGNPERATAAAKSPFAISLYINGPWLTCGTSTIFQVSLENLVFYGDTTATVLGGTTGQFYCLQMRDIYAAMIKSVLGTQTDKLLLTGAVFGGSWQINNTYAGAFHVGGSDNAFLWDQCLLASAPAFATAGGSSGQSLFWADYLAKTVIGPMYITAEGPWRGIRHDGAGPSNPTSDALGDCQYLGLRMEGTDPTHPCNGSLFTMNGGAATINGMWVAYAMGSPSTGEKGVIQHNEGQLTVVDVTYDAVSTAQTTSTTAPFVYTAGGSQQDVIVERIKRGNTRGTVSWGTNRPIVARATAGAENRIADATVSQITV